MIAKNIVRFAGLICVEHHHLKGPPIPKEIQHHYGATHGSRKIGIYSREKDRVIKWQCPDCRKEWERE